MGNMLRPPEQKTPEERRVEKRRFSFLREEPTVRGISFLPENQKNKWRKQTKKKLKIAFREKPPPTSRTAIGSKKEKVEEEEEEKEEPVELREESPLNENSESDGIQCEIVSCDMDNSSMSSTTSEPANLRSLSASWDDPCKHKFPFENLILSGGGTKGYAYLGAAKRRFFYPSDKFLRRETTHVITEAHAKLRIPETDIDLESSFDYVINRVTSKDLPWSLIAQLRII
ncbi:hypothetical protein CAPTEDRAFT_207628 [Capitella teleta]|uniref:Uncharacterized protein n=1 Tax=Capitella teleta TaxID=283909 RepID=R7TSM4_CAPTE|nr:hypothetical protein CAPTEDRAFT_207628 [Capitella teleta]|eukprot:ELT94486.1 hypothetical protein CAPTEDRAFT_207628 [Capitella teleta]